MIGEHLDAIDAGGPTPACLRKGQIRADGQDNYVFAQAAGLLIQASSLGITDARIDARHDADQPHLAGGIAQQVEGAAKAAVVQRYIGRFVAHSNRRAHDVQMRYRLLA